jgi:hypothetical protein
MSIQFKPDKARWREYWRGVHEIPRAWAVKGQELACAFDAVVAASQSASRSGFDVHGPALMLAGMAIENWLKSLLVNRASIRDVVTKSREPANDAEQKALRVYYTHDLVDLAEVAGLVLSEEQAAVANSLSQYITWRGRYVLPTVGAIDNIVPIARENGLVGVPFREITFEDAQDLIEVIRNEVGKHLYAKP